MKLTVHNLTNNTVVLPAPVRTKLRGGQASIHNNVNSQSMADNLAVWERLVDANQIEYITANDPTIPDNIEGAIVSNVPSAPDPITSPSEGDTLRVSDYIFTYTNLNAMVAFINGGGSPNTTLIVDTSIPSGVATTVTSNISLVFRNGNVIQVGTEALVIEGPVEAGLYPIFSYGGGATITMTSTSGIAAHTAWWGTTEVALQRALDCGLDHVVVDDSMDITSTVYFPEGITFEGRPRLGGTVTGVKFTFTGTGAALFPKNADGATDPTDSVVMKNFMINATGNANTNIIGIDGAGMRTSRFDNVFCTGFNTSGAIGLRIRGIDSAARGTLNKFFNCKFTGCTTGVVLTGILDAKSNSNKMYGCEFATNAIGMHIELGTGTMLSGCRFEGNSDIGLIIGDAKTMVFGCLIETNVNHGIDIPTPHALAGGGFGSWIMGNQYNNNGPTQANTNTDRVNNPNNYKLRLWEHDLGFLCGDQVRGTDNRYTYMVFSTGSDDWIIYNNDPTYAPVRGNVLKYRHTNGVLETNQILQVNNLATGGANQPVYVNSQGRLTLTP